MAHSRQSLIRQRALTYFWLFLLLALPLGTSLMAFAGLSGWRGITPDHQLWRDPWFWQVLGFTFRQALYSTFFSLLLAIPLARWLALDRHLPGKDWFLRWCLLCFVMPSLILMTGLVVLLGLNGWLTPWLGSSWKLYGLNGILIAHIFLNLPLAVRVLAFQWQTIPSGSWKLAAQLKVSGWQRFCWLEWPAIRSHLPALAGFIFLLCFNSFTIVLALGGGPAATTLEVAIYQALKYQFNPSEALFLAWTQLLLAGGLFWLFNRWGRVVWLGAATATAWLPNLSVWDRWLGRSYYLLILLFLTLPIISLLPVLYHAQWQQLPWSALLQASGWSLLLAIAASLLAVFFALALNWLHSTLAGRWLQPLIQFSALHPLILPGMVVSVGIYLFWMLRLDWLQWGWLAILLLNALVALPFAFSQLQPAVQDYQHNCQRLVQSLALHGRVHWLRVILPFLAEPLKRVLGLCFVLVLGDFAIFALFGQESYKTLPWLIYELTGSYQLTAAALASLWLLLLALLGMLLLEQGNKT